MKKRLRRKKRALSFRRLGLGPFAEQLKESAISPKAAKANKLRLGPDGLIFPYIDLWGKSTNFHRTRLLRSTAAKYLQPKGSACHLYIPQNNDNARKIRDHAETRIVVVEGEKKAISVAECLPEEWAAVAIGGVNSFWSERRVERVGPPIYTVFEGAGIPWLHTRAMYVCFDSDKLTNIRVREAEDVLLETLRERGCEVYSVDVPVGENGQRQGADDWIAAEGSGPFIDALFLCQPRTMSGVVRPLGDVGPIDLKKKPANPGFVAYPSMQEGANLWFGMPETLKSLTRNQALVDILLERPALFGGDSPWENRWDNPDRIMVVCSEEPMEEFASGLWRCFLGNKVPAQKIPPLLAKITFFSAPDYDLRLDRMIEAWESARRPRLVFADHLLGLMPRKNYAGSDINAVSDPSVVMDSFLQIRMSFLREGTSFVCNAHTAKSNESVFGSVAWSASSDTMTKFHRDWGDEDDDQNTPRIILEPHKRRHSARESSFALRATFEGETGAPYRFEYDGVAEVPGSGGKKISKEQQDEEQAFKILDHIEKNPGCTYDDMDNVTSYSSRKMRELVGVLETRGLIFHELKKKRKHWFKTSSRAPKGI